MFVLNNHVSTFIRKQLVYIHSTKKVSPPSSIFSYISKSILPILIIQTVMDKEFSYAKNEL